LTLLSHLDWLVFVVQQSLIREAILFVQTPVARTFNSLFNTGLVPAERKQKGSPYEVFHALFQYLAER
jgi:hypothetical protein